MKTKKIKKSSSSSLFESSDFHTAVATTAVAQICRSVGYTGAQTSAHKTLSDVAVRYLRSLAKSAATSAGSTGRTQCNLLDIIIALEDVHSGIGFPGNSDPKRGLNLLSDSSLLRSIMKFVYRTIEIPFAKPLPLRCRSVPLNPPCFSDEKAKWNHIPRWLPAFPKVSEGEEKEKAVVEEEMECSALTTTNKEASNLTKKRKKVSFKIGRGDRIEIELGFGANLMGGFCRGGKRISWKLHDDDQRFMHTSSSSNQDDNNKSSMELIKNLAEEPSSRTMMSLRS